VCLRWGEDAASVYSSGRPAGNDFVPGLSDIDLIVVLGGRREHPDVARCRVRRRWDRFGRAIPPLALIVDVPRVYQDTELGELVGSSALTYGLDPDLVKDPRQAAYSGNQASLDRARVLTRPRLYGATEGWHRLAGPERRPREPARDPQQQRIAGWLELMFWWRLLLPLCAEPAGPRVADLCVKSVAEAVRIWMWLAHGERVAGRVDALHRGLELLPEDEDGLRGTLELRRTLPGCPDAPLVDILPILVRLSTHIATVIEGAARAAGYTQVTLASGGPAELVLAGRSWQPGSSLGIGRTPRILPLTDWVGVACPVAPDDAFVPLTWDPADPSVLVAAAKTVDGPYPTLLAERLLVRPRAKFLLMRLRAIQCRATDPVSFALIEGSRIASFPNLRGWSAADTAQRAVDEHRAWLLTSGEPAAAATEGPGQQLGRLLSAVRAAAFQASIVSREPRLPLTLAEAIRTLASTWAASSATAEEALEHYRAFAEHGVPVPANTLPMMRRVVMELEPYRDR
jgi:hypothetical protein